MDLGHTFKSQNPSYEHLRQKLTAKHKDIQENFFQKHGDSMRHLTLGGLSGLMLLNTPGGAQLLPQQVALAQSQDIKKGEDVTKQLAVALKGSVPDEVRPLTAPEEDKIGKILSEKLDMKVSASLQGVKLNRSYGLIGGEQHLYRYPGDNVFKHSDSASDWAMYGPAGIAPGLGAWGYFAPSPEAFTDKDKEREKWYIAVQTFLSPGFAENVGKYRDFFKFRKMLLVNPNTGQAVVTDVADAGPADWTGKHLGGSPEVMEAVGLAGGPRKGPVLYFFIDDPNDQIPLGPVQVQRKGQS